MKKVLIVLMSVVFVFGLFSLAQAGKPNTGGEDPVFIGNGYPSGAHYNLNIHGKKDDFNCSHETWECTVPDGFGGYIVTKYDNQTECNACADVPDGVCAQTFGNVINVPYYADPFQILMESGRKGPKGNPGATELEVTDSCAGFSGHDNASFRLPANADGYAVYARITGKPGEGTAATFTSPDFEYVEDEYGNDLIELGQIVGTEVTEINSDSITIYRSTSSKGNKVSKATDISALFDYTGAVCYVNSVNSDGFDYCYDETQDPTDVCEYDQLCCDSQTIVADDPDTPEDESTVCDFFANVAVDYDDGNGLVCPNVVDSLEDPYLPYLIDVACRTYTDEWVFNIADFVGMLWDIVNNNSYNIKIRFYPLPLDTKVKP